MNRDYSKSNPILTDRLTNMPNPGITTLETLNNGDGTFSTVTARDAGDRKAYTPHQDYNTQIEAVIGHQALRFHYADYRAQAKLYPDAATHGQFLIFRKGYMAGGIIKERAKNLILVRGPYAQYRDAIHLYWQAHNQRTRIKHEVFTHGPLLILSGWDHDLEPESLYLDEEKSGNGVWTKRGRYRSADPRWTSNFIKTSDAYLANVPLEAVHLDARDYSAPEKERMHGF